MKRLLIAAVALATVGLAALPASSMAATSVGVDINIGDPYRGGALHFFVDVRPRGGARRAEDRHAIAIARRRAQPRQRVHHLPQAHDRRGNHLFDGFLVVEAHRGLVISQSGLVCHDPRVSSRPVSGRARRAATSRQSRDPGRRASGGAQRNCGTAAGCPGSGSCPAGASCKAPGSRRTATAPKPSTTTFG